MQSTLKHFTLSAGSSLRKISYPKGHILLQPGDTADKIWWVEEGLLREYVVLDNGVEVTTRIAASGMFIYAPASYLKGEPASTIIEVIEKCTVIPLPRPDLTPAIFRAVLESTLLQSERRFQILQLKRPGQRLEAYEKLYPELSNRIPLYYVASLLNITPQTLSRIRSRRVHRM